MSSRESAPINYPYFLSELLEAAPWPVFIIDRHLTILFYNQLASSLVHTTSSLQKLQFNSIVQDERILHMVQRCIATGLPGKGEHEYGQSGAVWKLSISPLASRPQKELQHDYTYFSIAIEDLTELRRLERVRRDFIANISHELRTPLASVRLLAETLEDAIDTDHEQAQIFVEKIENEVQHLSSLVSELLELSRIESGLIPMAIEPVRAEQMVREVMARMLPQAQRHRVTLSTSIHDGKTLVAADAKQIVRVLVNLIHNAIKFTPSGGTITIGTQLLENGQIQSFFVHDTGIGIQPEELPRVFERFYKADRSRSKSDFIGPGGGGSGLGLAIARHVIEAHGGRIRAESVPQKGSTFTFTLPISLPGNV